MSFYPNTAQATRSVSESFYRNDSVDVSWFEGGSEERRMLATIQAVKEACGAVLKARAFLQVAKIDL